MEEELTEEVEMAKRRIDEINMELNQVTKTERKILVLYINCINALKIMFDISL